MIIDLSSISLHGSYMNLLPAKGRNHLISFYLSTDWTITLVKGMMRKVVYYEIDTHGYTHVSYKIFSKMFWLNQTFLLSPLVDTLNMIGLWVIEAYIHSHNDEKKVFSLAIKS
jgi:hypothetical protein